MSGIKTYTQFDMKVRATEDNHLVRLSDMVEYVAGMSKKPVRVVMTDSIGDLIYDSEAMTISCPTMGDYYTIDGIDLYEDDRVLFAGLTNSAHNGIYVLTAPDITGKAVFTRAEDFDANTDFVPGIKIPVSYGSPANRGSVWKLTIPQLPMYEVGVTELNFEKLETTDLTKVVEVVIDIEGDDTTTMFTFAHNLNTKNIIHESYDVDGSTIVGGFKRVDADNCNFELGVPLGTGNDITVILHADTVEV